MRARRVIAMKHTKIPSAGQLGAKRPAKEEIKGAIHRERLGVGKSLDVKVKEGMKENAQRRKEGGVNKKAERRRGCIARQTEHPAAALGRKLSDDLLHCSCERHAEYTKRRRRWVRNQERAAPPGDSERSAHLRNDGEMWGE
ncbi:hypothetical protein B0H14DRAFT_2618800 [Mycena olivaceomarginata]|nr:hypothetical protein B0H14DRAFT_2618800 [Mycena olivaceomarginata]